MQRMVTMLGFLAALPGVAWADDDCFVPMAGWQPRDAVQRLAEENGWTVRRIKIDDGCYEIDGRDTEGRRIEVTVHPATLDVIELEYEDDDEYEGDHPSRKDREERGRD
ncbi:PepSY domain-containing protein [uncultured Paracoccus sp.]|uniref:PepSY domain-containing protein n=1 Tax=uncultured Paracoccus sp. TaxID=189685 RepID=UPI002629807C|nr:PepSY domain-containing protein [uncultured Paracoccus sp.]